VSKNYSQRIEKEQKKVLYQCWRNTVKKIPSENYSPSKRYPGVTTGGKLRMRSYVEKLLPRNKRKET
jgi:hypothetical protein